MTCKHFPTCGGCQNQHLDEAFERVQKTDNFIKILRFQEITAEISDYKTVPLYSRRRASFTAKRTKKTVQIGFMEMATHNVFEIHECLVILPEILKLIPFMQIITPIVASRSALVKFHITACDNGIDFVIENGKEIDGAGEAKLATHCAPFDIRRLTLNDAMVYKDEPPKIAMTGHDIHLPPHPFLQASLACENWLREWTQSAVSNSKTIVDLFSGIGTFSFGLNKSIDAYEGDRTLSEHMQSNLNRLTINNITAHYRDLFRDPLSDKELAKFDAAIIDPPRAGAQNQVQMLAKSNVPIIAYISCDAQSFARDARILQNGGYHIRDLKLIDQFRFSNHLESFALFEKTT